MILTIAFPSRGSTDPAFAANLRRLSIPKDFNELEVLYVPGADVATARNMLANGAHGDYIFFVDDDVLPPMNVIEKLYSHNKDIVSGLYFARREPFFPQIYEKTKVKGKEESGRYDAIFDIPQDKLIEVDACGGGCMLIKADVFDKLEAPLFQSIPGTEKRLHVGEDFFFCKKAKEAGYKIYCDTSIQCKHIATAYITEEYWNASKERIYQLKKQLGEEKFEEYKQKFWDYFDNQKRRQKVAR
jgi:hypothetical protein